MFNVKAECARPRPSFGILKVLRSKQKPISFTAPAQCPLSVRRNAILNCKLSLFCTGGHKPSLPLVFSVCLCRHSGGGGGAGQSATTLSNTLKGQVRCEVWGVRYEVSGSYLSCIRYDEECEVTPWTQWDRSASRRSERATQQQNQSRTRTWIFPWLQRGKYYIYISLVVIQPTTQPRMIKTSLWNKGQFLSDFPSRVVVTSGS